MMATSFLPSLKSLISWRFTSFSATSSTRRLYTVVPSSSRTTCIFRPVISATLPGPPHWSTISSRGFRGSSIASKARRSMATMVSISGAKALPLSSSSYHKALGGLLVTVVPAFFTSALVRRRLASCTEGLVLRTSSSSESLISMMSKIPTGLASCLLAPSCLTAPSLPLGSCTAIFAFSSSLKSKSLSSPALSVALSSSSSSSPVRSSENWEEVAAAVAAAVLRLLGSAAH
mmetsp:Transcript_39874/g.113123  ORF Transcript_39874/g.113123 Transcript_39874/m.113123 type:complete len:232 (+) Transcript_39874:236-931(+)